MSPARWLNEERYRTELPAEADVDPDAAPQWELVTNRPGWAWHDHRTHFMSMSLPPAVEAAPDEPHLIQEWEVPLQVDGAREAVTGELRWVPGPSPWPWLAFGLAVPLVGLAGLSRRHQPGRGLVAPAVVVLGAVVVLNVTRLVDDVFALPLPTGEVVLAAGQTALFLAIAALGLVKAWRGGDGAYTALAVASGAILVGQGLLYVDVLSASQIASLLPGDFGRAVAALSIGQAVPSAVIAWVGSRQQVPADHEPVHDPTPAST